MTIASQISRITYTGNGSTVDFSVPFFFQTNADIVVIVRNNTTQVETTQTLGSDYTLVGATLDAGGTCTFVVAPSSGYQISIYRDPQLTQTTDYNDNDPFAASSHERALDKACTIDQRTRDLVLRAIRISDGEASPPSVVLGTVAARKNKVLGFDSSGALTYVVSDALGGGGTGSLAAANNLSDLANVATARTNLGLVIGTNVQAFDADLAALAANSTNGLWAHTASGTGAARTVTAGNGITVTNGDGVSGNPTIAQSANAQIDTIQFVIDGGGSTISTGLKGYLEVPFACTITKATLLANQSGSIVVDVFKSTYSLFDASATHPTASDKITASAPPTISSATKSQDAALTGWTTSVSAGDILAFNVNSATSIQRVTISLKVTHI